MTILYVITSLRVGGAEKLMVDLLPRLKNMGNDVELLLFDGTRTPFYEELENTGIKIYSLSIGGNVYNPFNILRIRKYLNKYDIIHTHNTACQYFVPLAKIITRSKCKLITTEHSTNNRRREYKLFKFIDKYIYKKYINIISISSKATESLLGYIENIDNIETIENGINLSKYKELPRIDINSNTKIISMVAGFREAKDQDTLIKSIAQLPDNYNLWLIGDGERRCVLEKLVKELGIEERVKFWGVRSDIPELLSKSHIVVLSSHWEGFGLVAVEGMAASKPVIASDVDGLREVVNGAGILFPHQDVHTLTNEIKKLTTDNNYYNTIVVQCQKRASQYDINIMAKKYLSIYNNVF